jgi:hypothetical protein
VSFLVTMFTLGDGLRTESKTVGPILLGHRESRWTLRQSLAKNSCLSTQNNLLVPSINKHGHVL